MKKSKGKIISKKNLVLSVLVFALSAAVWLNMRYASTETANPNTTNSGGNLGDSVFVDASVQTQAQADYFTTARQERTTARTEAIELLNSTINNVKSDEQAKQEAEKKKAEIAKRMEQESAIETLVKAKGFPEVLAVISEESVNIIVKTDELLGSETLQIQDIVLSQTEEKLENIKIVAVK